MSLLVREPFHLNGTLKLIGEVLSDAEAALVEADAFLMSRCTRFHLPIPPALPKPKKSAPSKSSPANSIPEVN